MRRLATQLDLEAVHAIYMHDAVVPYLSVEPMDLDGFRPVFDGLLAGANFFVFEQDGQVAGFYRAERFSARTGHVVHLGPLAVAPGLHGRGVARAMMQDALDRLAGEGVLRVELLAEADNARGLAFYRRMGFAVEGVQRAAYRRAGDAGFTDEVMMARFLGVLAHLNTATAPLS
ncbi:GNAT family N-acetyltransferase [Zavarzinia sp. CC-PAN008]|uniref:GNAT family N-acetyltransferase n=1 Tax=Zavarzinia sp. CC-PAN008 TaxID=3243332 RepID=UPI003F7463DA